MYTCRFNAGICVVSVYVYYLYTQRECAARVIVVVLCVCLSVCYPYSSKASNEVSSQMIQRLQLDITKKVLVFINIEMLCSEVMAGFIQLRTQLSLQAYHGILWGKSSYRELNFDNGAIKFDCFNYLSSSTASVEKGDKPEFTS